VHLEEDHQRKSLPLTLIGLKHRQHCLSTVRRPEQLQSQLYALGGHTKLGDRIGGNLLETSVDDFLPPRREVVETREASVLEGAQHGIGAALRRCIRRPQQARHQGDSKQVGSKPAGLPHNNVMPAQAGIHDAGSRARGQLHGFPPARE